MVSGTEAARRLGMSESAFRRFARNAGIDHVAGPRSPYSWAEIQAALARSRLAKGDIGQGSLPRPRR